MTQIVINYKFYYYSPTKVLRLLKKQFEKQINPHRTLLMYKVECYLKMQKIIQQTYHFYKIYNVTFFLDVMLLINNYYYCD